MSKRALCLLAALALCASCKKLVEGQQLFRDMMALRGKIAEQFHEKRVQVNVIKNGTVVVMFVNSPLQSAPAEEKQKRADEVAMFVMKNCKQAVPEVRVFFLADPGGLDRYTGHAKPV